MFQVCFFGREALKALLQKHLIKVKQDPSKGATLTTGAISAAPAATTSTTVTTTTTSSLDTTNRVTGPHATSRDSSSHGYDEEVHSNLLAK